ncbi:MULTISPECIES: transketolase [unclassified Colwellia]|jgi:transketolase|uniref:transketolase n=1 Tax=unclassified Colwellia TaxID=196834 RepID=UPI0015F6AF01|nr:MULTISPECIES: transketolase [unclassified Colwellia]MBA6335918.1 transketolase [Colwellia sp. BRX8-7]MBA6350708.1 transketolase [Colwellia sp. BRX9-1]MBA6377680.1 transketolase [Colwellia sp. BRX10-7]MBA6382506.1 transketolase [Colwellia sp. BRX10-9]MBA6385348.1 transketolase [Colwellia sp. BRX10-2]
MPSRQELANAIRALSMDAVQKAKSGHPGAPMGMADIAEVLWRDFLKHNPTDPNWTDRDRFVLSNGHGSMLIYSLLHLTGYELPIEELKNFRQLHSKTPGHPEYGYTPGVETTTGPLGAGISNAVGMAIAERTLAAQFNRPGHDIVDHFTYCFLGDGCLMEGISHEVCSLAGTLGLGKLVAFWDDNGISIDGKVEGWFTDDTPARFEAYGWHVISVDGHDSAAIAAAITAAKAVTDKPSMICCKTIIGFGSPNKEGTHDCHGAPLGDDEIAATRKALNWPHAPFEIPSDVYAEWDQKEKGQSSQVSWNDQFSAYQQAHPALAAEYERRVIKGDLPSDFEEKANALVQACQDKGENIASRKASQNTIEAFGAILPELLGGSADLAGSNLTLWSGSKGIEKDAAGNYIYYGVREFGMSGIMNGVSLHGGFINYGATFMMFMEYARNAVRMSALMGIQNIFVYTHDSIGQGEDGPTHQPIEQLTNLRTTPNMDTWRPCDATESVVAWKSAIERKNGPTSLIFSRQGLPAVARNSSQVTNIAKGAYVLQDCEGTADVILIATGSEVSLALDSAKQLTADGKKVRVVSMPSTNTFDVQSSEYKESVLPSSVIKRVAIEAAHTDFWYKYVGFSGAVVGMTTFGESAPGNVLLEHFGFTVANVVKTVNQL